MLFVILTTFLMPFCVLASWHSVQKRLKEYMIAFLLLEVVMVGVFVALDIVLFYVFFEATLIPMFVIIGVWGGKDRSEEHTSELQSLMRISYAVFCLKTKNNEYDIEILHTTHTILSQKPNVQTLLK